TEKSSYVWAKAFDAAIAGQGSADKRTQSIAAAFQRLHRLRRSYASAIQLLGNHFGFGGFQPHYPHIVHVRHYGGDGATLAVGRLRSPRLRRQVFDQILVDAVIGTRS